MSWTWDAPKGVALNKELTESLLIAAMQDAGVSVIIEELRWDRNKYEDYFYSIKYDGNLEDSTVAIVDKLYPALVAIIKKHQTWVMQPALRAMVPMNLGKTRIIGWYGITGKPKTLCSMPNRHAPDCECGTL